MKRNPGMMQKVRQPLVNSGSQPTNHTADRYTALKNTGYAT